MTIDLFSCYFAISSKGSKIMNLLKLVYIIQWSLIVQTKEFFRNSTLHGVQYFVKHGISPGSRFIWFCLTAVATVTTLVIIISLWEKFQIEPTITAVEAIEESDQIIFPGIIICSRPRYDALKIDTFSTALSGSNATKKKLITDFLKIISTLSFQHISDAFNISTEISPSWFGDRNIRELSFEVQPDCNSILNEICYFGKIKHVCCDMFRPTYSEYGFCFGLNNNFESTVNESLIVSNMLYTKRLSEWGLSVRPKMDYSLYVISPDENFLPGFHQNFDLVVNQSLYVSLKSDIVYVTDEVRDLTIKQRNCIFRNEVTLKYYSGNYSLTNCFMDCILARSIEYCQCRPPFFNVVANISMCGIKDLSCLASHGYKIRNLKECRHCHPTCERNDISIVKLTQIKKEENQQLFLFWNSWPNMRYKTEVVFGWMDLLVAFGGIASLFIGFSILSGIEIIYYFTLRAACNIYKEERQLIEMKKINDRIPPPIINLNLTIGEYKINTAFSKQSKITRKRLHPHFNNFNKELHVPLVVSARKPLYRNPFEPVQPVVVPKAWISKQYLP